MSTIADSRPGGLVGAVSGLAARIGNISHRAEGLALGLVFVAGVITILKKAGLEIPNYAMHFGITLGIAALLYEMHSAKAMARAWFNAKPGALTAALAIWLCAFGYSVNNWMGAASESQAEKSNLHKAAFLATGDTRKALADAEAKVARLSEARMLMKPKTSASAAQAVVNTSEAHKRFRDTDGCKLTNGKNQRAFCDAYASAVSDVALWDQIAKQEIELGEAEAAAADARKVAATTKVETHEGRNDLVILTKYAGLTEEDAQIFNGLGAIIAISIFLSFGSMRAELEKLAATGRRRPFNVGLALRRWYYRIVHGKEPPNVTIEHNHYGTIDGISASRLRQELDRRPSALVPA